MDTEAGRSFSRTTMEPTRPNAATNQARNQVFCVHSKVIPRPLDDLDRSVMDAFVDEPPQDKDTLTSDKEEDKLAQKNH